jgi:hypothetical protein
MQAFFQILFAIIWVDVVSFCAIVQLPTTEQHNVKANEPKFRLDELAGLC